MYHTLYRIYTLVTEGQSRMTEKLLSGMTLKAAVLKRNVYLQMNNV